MHGDSGAGDPAHRIAQGKKSNVGAESQTRWFDKASPGKISDEIGMTPIPARRPFFLLSRLYYIETYEAMPREYVSSVDDELSVLEKAGVVNYVMIGCD
jgi:hypothetical protein